MRSCLTFFLSLYIDFAFGSVELWKGRVKGLEHYAWHLYERPQLFRYVHRKLMATLTLMTNPPFYDDDNKLNFYPLAV